MTSTDDRRARAPDAAFAALSDVVLALASARTVEPVLQRLVHAARELVGARYAALGTPDGAGGFSRFLTSGLSPREQAAIGPLPRTHGLLGAMLADSASYRTDDITADPRFWGWPARHPSMRSFLGVPVVARDEVVGALYLTDKVDGATFDDADQRVVELLAAHAAIAIDNARLAERSRELTVAEERDRLARELHDAMTQTLFSLSLTAEAGAAAGGDAPAAARAPRATGPRRGRESGAGRRGLIVGLRAAAHAADGLAATLRKDVEVLGRAQPVALRLRAGSERRLPPEVERELYRIVQEALHNALRHARAANVDVSVDLAAGRCVVEVRDDGVGFDPDDACVTTAHLGLSSMRARAAALGAALTITSAPGAGTGVRVELPGD